MEPLRRFALALVIIGAINWGLIGLFQFDLVAFLFGGQNVILSRLVYVLVGLSGLYCLTLLFEPMHGQSIDRSEASPTNDLNYRTEFSEEENLSNVRNRENKD